MKFLKRYLMGDLNMKVELTDIIWAVLSMFIVGYSFLHGWLIYGIILIYVLMALLFFGHIAVIRARLSRSKAVLGTVIDYYERDKGQHVYPIVSYTTEEDRDITSTYTVQDKKKRYELRSDVTICYDPEEPMFFYFPDRENDLTKEYTRAIFIGGAVALILLIVAQTR